MTKLVSIPKPKSLKAYLDGPPAVGQRALADAVGCHQSMVSQLKNGTRVPSAGLAVRLHAVTGVPLKRLLDPQRKVSAKRR